jgi:hypothetical protein
MADYVFYMRPATERILNFQNPYVDDVYYPPWTFVPFLPLALLPLPVAKMVLFLVGGASFVYACHRLEFGTWETLLFMLSPPVIYCLAQGNIDWLVLWGLALPYPWDIPFFLAKPQMGWGIVVVQLRHLSGNWKILAGIFYALMILAVAVFPIMKDVDWNVAVQPRLVAVVVGFACMWMTRKWKNPYAWAATASILISPYLTLGSYSMVLLLWADDHKWLLPLATVGGWGVLILEVVI